MAERVTICEMSPRDGMQSVNRDSRIPIVMRVELIEVLQRAGFPYIEAASFVSPRVFPQFADSGELMARLKPYDGQLAALVPNEAYYQRFKDTPNLTTVAVFLSASDEYSRKNKRISLSDDLDDAKRIAAAARVKGHRLRAHLSGAFRDLTVENRPSDQRQVVSVCRELIGIGCETVALADTDGRATADDLRRITSSLCEAGIGLGHVGIHLHDREGHAIEIARLALELGVRTFDAAVGGIGGNRASTEDVGNVATEILIDLFTELGFDLGIDLDALRDARRLVAKMVELSNS
jgi:hydroxymethylglutaryl-CoA lyase